MSIMLFASCELVQVDDSNNAENIENIEINDNNLNGSLEDPIENPEIDWKNKLITY